jgi:hypothetical protein
MAQNVDGLVPMVDSRVADLKMLNCGITLEFMYELARAFGSMRALANVSVMHKVPACSTNRGSRTRQRYDTPSAVRYISSSLGSTAS